MKTTLKLTVIKEKNVSSSIKVYGKIQIKYFTKEEVKVTNKPMKYPEHHMPSRNQEISNLSREESI